MTQSAIHEQSREAWRLVRLHGWTQRQVAAELGINQSTISRRLKDLEAEMAAEFKDEVDSFRARQTMILEHVAQQAFAAWDRSARILAAAPPVPFPQPEHLNTRTPEHPPSPEAEALPVGDPRFLSLVLRANSEFRRLWALDSPRTPATPNPKSKIEDPKSDVPQVDRVIYEVNRLPGIYEEPERANPPARPAPGRINPEPVPPRSLDARPRTPDAASRSAEPPGLAAATPPSPPSVMHASPTADACPPPDPGPPSVLSGLGESLSGKGAQAFQPAYAPSFCSETPTGRLEKETGVGSPIAPQLEPSESVSNSNSNSNSVGSPSGSSTLNPQPPTPKVPLTVLPRRTISGAVLPGDSRT